MRGQMISSDFGSVFCYQLVSFVICWNSDNFLVAVVVFVVVVVVVVVSSSRHSV